MKRSPVNRVRDSFYFKNTANATKSINLSRKIYRGGIRL